jgi:hypothetical protein
MSPNINVVTEYTKDNSFSFEERQPIYREHDMIKSLTTEQFERYKSLQLDEQVWVSQLISNGLDFHNAFLKTIKT